MDAVTSLTINSGKVTQEDLAYLKSISRLETFEMNVGDNLQLIGMDGQPTTVLSKDTAVIEFAPKRAGSSRADMTTLTLGGITEIYNGGSRLLLLCLRYILKPKSKNARGFLHNHKRILIRLRNNAF